jgi:hypothetical protein
MNTCDVDVTDILGLMGRYDCILNFSILTYNEAKQLIKSAPPKKTIKDLH